MNGFVYRWVNLSNNMYYIGSHKGLPSDGYIGSGIYFKRAYKNNPSNFVRDVLYQGNNFRELEEFILEELDSANDKKSYNLKNSAIGGKLDDSVYQKQRNKLKGKKLSSDIKQKMSYSSTKFSLYCTKNNKQYNNCYDAANDLGYTPNHIRYMSSHQDNRNHLGLIRIKKI